MSLVLRAHVNVRSQMSTYPTKEQILDDLIKELEMAATIVPGPKEPWEEHDKYLRRCDKQFTHRCFARYMLSVATNGQKGYRNDE